MSLDLTIKTLKEYSSLLDSFRKKSQDPVSQKQLSDELTKIQSCIHYLQTLEPSPQLRAWEKNQAAAMKNWNPPPWDPRGEKKGRSE